VRRRRDRPGGNHLAIGWGRGFALAAVLPGLALLATGCGAGSAAPSVASVGATSTSGTSSATGTTVSGQEVAAEFVEYARMHGVPGFPDPNSGGGFDISSRDDGGIDPGSPRFQAAQQACQNASPRIAP
jgi:hypothetical protein